MKEATLCKFHGKFADLIPAGFKFQKLFANNYRQYCWEVVKYCDHIRVWQAHGGYVELNNYYSASQCIVNAILKGFKWHQYAGNESFGFLINRKTNEIEEYIPRIHSPTLVAALWEKGGRSEIDIDQEINRLYDNYRHERLSPELYNAVKTLADRGWIKAT